MATTPPEAAYASDELLQLLLAFSNISITPDPDQAVSDAPSAVDESENPFLLSWWIQLTYALAFGLMLTVATIGNSIVIWAVLSHKVMSSATNYFLVNVSVADLMMATFNAMFNFAFMIRSDWPFGAVYCTINNFVATLTVALSVFSLMAISVDRYTAIMKPLTPRMPKHVALGIIVVIWLAGSLLSLPNLLYSKIAGIQYRDGSLRTLCFLRWPDGLNVTSKLDYSYNVIILVVTYVLPISAMSFTYLRIGRELWGSTYIGECCDKQIANIKSKKRVVRMLIVVLTIFAICWLPYHAYFIIIAHHKNVISSKYIQHIYLIIYFAAMSSSMYNPIIYFKMNSRSPRLQRRAKDGRTDRLSWRFRLYFLTALRCCRPPHGSASCVQSGTFSHPNCHSMCERNMSIRRQSQKLSNTSNGHFNGSKKSGSPRTSLLRNESKRSYLDQDGHTIPADAAPSSTLKFWVRKSDAGIEL